MLSTAKYNFHDYFIILIIASTIIGTAQIGLISHAFVVGLLCLPLILLEIVSSFRKGKMQPIVLFITIWIVYALLSVTWAPKHEYLLREIWKLSWNIVIFIGLYHASRKANSIQQSFMTGWRILICQFNSFAHNYYNLPNNIEYTSPTTPINKPYDCVIVGSDQIWRNHITNEQYIGFDSTYFCQTIEENTPCISYAASMGIVHLVNNDRTNLCNYLKRFNTLLVREKSLQELIERMGYSAHVVLDPTLLLTKEQWNTIIPTQRFRQKNTFCIANCCIQERVYQSLRRKQKNMATNYSL